ncbi:MAG: phthalate 4,5-cis-dihydrodiol dehydrogenase [Burkholderiales bacterium]
MSGPAQKGADSRVRVGIVGLGAAGRAFIPAIQAHSGFTLVAVADPIESIRAGIASEFNVSAYATIDALLQHPGLDAIFVATPTELHPPHVAQACASGKHVLVEKPMAVHVDQAKKMIADAEEAGVVLLVGHSHSYDLPIKRMRELIAGGSLGRVRMVNTWCFSDWIYRPRRPEELDTSMGGGVTLRQGSHQFDIIRLLCGGVVRSVKAKTFDWDPDRRALGAHIVYLDFAEGAAATAVYNGYGNMSSMDLCFNVSEWGFLQPPESRVTARKPTANTSPEAELRAKQERARNAIPAAAPFQPFFGLTVVSCERGDIRQSPQGLYVHTQQGREEIVLPTDQSPRDLVMSEFHDAITGRAPALHDGRWGLANLEVCDAAIASSATGAEVLLHHQVATPAR